jgi:regulator of sigma D
VLTDFEEVIENLERKSKKELIAKYSRMKTVKEKHINKNAKKLDTFAGSKIIDSAVVEHGSVIKAFMKKWIESKRESNGKNDLNLMNTNNLKAKSD